MSSDSHPPRHRPGRHFLAGFLTIIPLGVTLLVLVFLKNLVASIGRGPVLAGKDMLEKTVGQELDLLSNKFTVDLVAVIFVIVFIYVLGLLTSNFLGKRLLQLFEQIMARIPLVRNIYGSVKKLVELMNQGPEGDAQRVVLIEFPSSDMKTIGIVTRTMEDSKTGRKLAAVYVPTTPNPTNGFLEIVPVERLVPTDWTFDQAISCIVSGGATAPDRLRFTRDVEKQVAEVPETTPDQGA